MLSLTSLSVVVGGGICVYVHEDWQVTEFLFPNQTSYRITRTYYQQEIRKANLYCCTVSPEKTSRWRVPGNWKIDTYIRGDLNLEFSRPITPECRKFRSMLFQLGFVQLVSDPTHQYVSNGVHKESVIDLILTNSKSFQNISGVMPCHPE